MSADKREQLVDSRPIQPSGPVVYAVPVFANQGGAPASASATTDHVANPPPTVQGAVLHHQYATHPSLYVTTTNVPQATVVTLMQTAQFGSGPARITCPFCGADVITGIKVTPSITAHLWALGLCIFGCWPCCLVPYCVDSCQSHIHTCPNCNHEVGYHGL